ncbi:MAG: 30S ribosomal protein S17 [Patescibacteria group bacterium]|jgi:small subunit ribosomal protein S17|nr:30S ribosomal protein S17 [Patescibacteria group bacterium]
MKRVLRGKVVSDKSEKTITVLVERTKKHPLYRKNYKASTKFLVHDEKNEYKVGDTVDITESRPLSSKKRWVATHKVTAKELEK